MKNKGRTHSENERRDTPKRDTLDFHRSPIEAVQCMLATEYLALRRFSFIHDMACGDGALVLPLRDAGFKVIASDIVDRGCPRSHVQDYLDPSFGPDAAQRRRIAAFTNPPFNRAEEFITKACAQYDYVAMILRLRFLAAKHLVDDHGVPIRSGKPLWRGTRIPFARLILPKGRWPMMHRDDYDGEKIENGMIDFAIFVWDAEHQGAAQIIMEPDPRFVTAFQPQGEKAHVRSASPSHVQA
jgi:hypothetical protein